MAKRCTTFLPRDGGVSADTLGARIRSIPLATSPHGSRTAACSFLPRWSLLLSQQRAFIQLNWGKRTQTRLLRNELVIESKSDVPSTGASLLCSGRRMGSGVKRGDRKSVQAGARAAVNWGRPRTFII